MYLYLIFVSLKIIVNIKIINLLTLEVLCASIMQNKYEYAK